MGKEIPPDKLKEINDHIFDLLEAGIYTTITKAIREAVSNSYDAGAKNVDIIIDTKRKLETSTHDKVAIQIHDDGCGMSGDDFWEFYASILNTKKNPLKKNKWGRYDIGKFGIGSFAFVPFVDEFKIYSKKDSAEPIECKINCKVLRETRGRGYKEHVSDAIKVVSISDQQWEAMSLNKFSGTMIVIEGVKKEVHKQLLYGSRTFREEKVGQKIFTTDECVDFTDGLKEIAWDLKQLLPVQYEDGDVYKEYKHYLKSENPSINITFCSVPLHRTIYSNEGREVRTFSYKNDEINANGIIIANPSIIDPYLTRGIILRLNNVGIGSYSFHGVEGHKNAKQRVTGEIHVNNKLCADLEANRDGFKEYGELYSDLNDALHAYITQAIDRALDPDFKPPQKKAKEKAKKQKENKKKKEMVKNTKTKETAVSSKSGSKKITKTVSTKDKEKSKGGKRSGIDEHTTPPKRIKPIQIIKDEPVYDEKNIIFEKYHYKHAKATIRNILLALELSGIDDDTFFRILDQLVEMKNIDEKDENE
jgi:hypothetical protein